MLFLSFAFAFLFFGLVVAQDRSLSAVKRAFEDAKIPQDMTLSFDPKVLLDVTYPQPSGEPITLHAGIQLPKNATADPPSFSVLGDAGRPGPFVVALIDPDALTPQNPNISQVRHYLSGDFVLEGHDLKHTEPELLTNTTPAVTEYYSPRPPVFSGPHRYVFLLYKQSKEFNDQTLITHDTSRLYFNISSFAAAVGLGQPIGGTFVWIGPDQPTA